MSSRPISDGQLYGLMWVAGQSTGMISELHDPPRQVTAFDGRPVVIYRTCFDRPGLLGLGRRGLLTERKAGLWEITDAGRAELQKPRIKARITALADATAAYNRREPSECFARNHAQHAVVTCNGRCCTSCGGPIDENACRC